MNIEQSTIRNLLYQATEKTGRIPWYRRFFHLFSSRKRCLYMEEVFRAHIGEAEFDFQIRRYMSSLFQEAHLGCFETADIERYSVSLEKSLGERSISILRWFIALNLAYDFEPTKEGLNLWDTWEDYLYSPIAPVDEDFLVVFFELVNVPEKISESWFAKKNARRVGETIVEICDLMSPELQGLKEKWETQGLPALEQTIWSAPARHPKTAPAHLEMARRLKQFLVTGVVTETP